MATHFYTDNLSEQQSAIHGGFNDEGIACYVYSSPPPGPAPFYRAYQPRTGGHFYTMSVTERDNATNNLGWVSEGIACYICSQPQPGTIPLYRAYQPSTDDHFYTTSLVEHNNAVQHLGYNEEGVAGYLLPTQASVTVPLYRLFKQTHFYTDDPNERLKAIQGGFNDEGIAGYVYNMPPVGPEPLFRAYQPHTGGHLYTMDIAERDNATNNLGWKDEGIACYIYSVPQPGTVPLYRAFQPASDDHFYTTNWAEHNAAVQHLGYNEEGITGYVRPQSGPGLIPFERLYGPFARGCVANFKPSVNGFRFTNCQWPSEPDIVVNVPLLGNVAIGNASNGLCGGMAFVVRDLFESHQPTPSETTPPPEGSSLFKEIVVRLMDSFNLPDGVAQYYSWMTTPDHDTGVTPFIRRGVVWHTVVEEWPKIKAEIDSGHPSCLGLVTVYDVNPASLGQNHQVLAYAYEVDAANNLTLHLYDPNTDHASADTVHLSMSLSDPSHSTAIQHNVNIPDPIRGFFQVHYSIHAVVSPFSLQTGTPITLADATNFDFAVSDRDLYCLKRANTGTGALEVHVLKGNSNYQSFSLHTGTPIPLSDVGNFVFAVSDGDLYCLKRSNTGTGALEVHVLSGADDFHSFSLHTGTPIPLSDVENFVFAVSHGDLYCVKRANTGTGTLEVHVLRKSDNYHSFSLHTGTPMPLSDVGNFVFAVSDSDLYCLKRANTGTGTLEVHVLKGNNDYQSYSLHTGTPIALSDAVNFVFAVSNGDLYCLKRANTGTGTLEVHVLSGGNNYC